MSNITMKNIEDISKVLDTSCIFIGGSALPFYGVELHTEDIDLEAQGIGSMAELESIRDLLSSCGVDIEVSADVSGWSMIPLPEGYRDRAVQTSLDNIFVLDPVDYVLSKMRRGTDKDIEASLAVCETKEISIEAIEARMELIHLPIDIASGMFGKRMEHFFSLIPDFDSSPFEPR